MSRVDESSITFDNIFTPHFHYMVFIIDVGEMIVVFGKGWGVPVIDRGIQVNDLKKIKHTKAVSVST